MAAVNAVHETLKALRDGTPPADIKTVASPELMKQVTRQADYAKWSQGFPQCRPGGRLNARMGLIVAPARQQIAQSCRDYSDFAAASNSATNRIVESAAASKE